MLLAARTPALSDELDYIRESKQLVLVNDILYRWDEVCQDFESLE